jgi:hypothetical protein
MRCMADARPVVGVDAREVDQPGDAEELHSPYLEGGLLDIVAWARTRSCWRCRHRSFAPPTAGACVRCAART